MPDLFFRKPLFSLNHYFLSYIFFSQKYNKVDQIKKENFCLFFERRDFMEKLMIQVGKGYFYKAFYSRDDKVEFELSYPRIEGRKIFNKERGAIEAGETFIKLSDSQIKDILNFERTIKRDVIDLYKNIVKGEEKIMCLPFKSPKTKFIITTQTILDKRHLSPKYSDALLFAFSKKCLSSFGINKHFDFKDQSEMLIEVSSILESMNCDKKTTLTLKEILNKEAS